MAVKSNVLTHFTNSIDNLKSILKNNFIPRLCKESYTFLDKNSRNLLIPMVCFCDIPLHLIHEHVTDYGSYGIGLSKEWGIKNGLNPIIYLGNNTTLSNSFNIIISNLPALQDQSINRNLNILENFWKINCLLKPYEGVGKNGKMKIFYEENEWRYIPNELHKECLNGEILELTPFEDDVSEEKKKLINDILKSKPLIF